MFLVGLLSWWYGDGFIARIHLIVNRLNRIGDFFSVSILAKTLFSPYKQISAGQKLDASETKFEVLIDKIISRLIGFFARMSLIIIGCLAMAFECLFGVAVIIFWLIAPIVPVAGLIMYVIGWVPIWTI
jgi:hypothetical protein